MNIFVNGREAALKEDFSFEYISENRLFLGRDGYTLEFSFPLKDCPQNIEIFGHLHRIDVAKVCPQLDCIISTRDFSIAGALLITGISDIEVKCQFAEGRCRQNLTNPFDEIYINTLNVDFDITTRVPSEITPANATKSYDSGAKAVALSWVNDSYPTVPNNWIDPETKSWESEVKSLTYNPYLLALIEGICNAVGYTCTLGDDLKKWSPLRNLVVCNVIPQSWEKTNPEMKALPHWTVSEFFEKLELFLGGSFEIDHSSKTVSFSFYAADIDKLPPVELADVVDAYSVEVAADDNASCDYLGGKILKYKSPDHGEANYYDCPWFIASQTPIIYPTLQELVDRNKPRALNTDVFWGEKIDGITPTTVRNLLYAADVMTYFVFRAIGTEHLKWAQGTTGPLGNSDSREYDSTVFMLQPVNVFGHEKPISEDEQVEELEFVPVCIQDMFISESDDRGFMMCLNPNAADDDNTLPESDGGRPTGTSSNFFDTTLPLMYISTDGSYSKTFPCAEIEAGAKENGSTFYDTIYVAFWNGSGLNIHTQLTPTVDIINFTRKWNWTAGSHSGQTLRLCNRPASLGLQPLYVDSLPKIDKSVKFKFSWLGSSIPNPRSIFFIRGKRYLCEKITATFSKDGMSQLLKGEFYPLAED